MRTIEEFKAKSFLPGFFSKKRPFFLIPVSDTGVSFKVTDSFKEDYVALRFGIEPVYEGNAIHVLVWLGLPGCVRCLPSPSIWQKSQ